MSAPNQDFITYQGDSVAPIFSVFQTDGVTPLDISGVSNISWSARRNLTDSVVLTKSKTGGGIAFTNTGTDGKFTLTLAGTDTTALLGWYIHQATITDGSGNITTVTVGRMNVGSSPNWTYDDGTSATEDIYLARAMIGDTLQSDQILSDQVIVVSLNRYSTVENACAELCRFIAARYAREVDIVQGQLKTNYSQKSKTYLTLAVKLDQLGYARGGVTAYTGGTSISDKDSSVLNLDRVPPQFNIGMFDNTLPESPVGHQTGVGQEDLGLSISDQGTDVL